MNSVRASSQPLHAASASFSDATNRMTMAGESSSVNSVSLCPAVQRFIELLEKRPLEFDNVCIALASQRHGE